MVFEKVNTGGVPLSVFDLVTATYAAEGFNLRSDWFGDISTRNQGRHKKLTAKALLRDLEPTDFLQGISLLYTYGRFSGTPDRAEGRTGKDVTAVSAKREQVLQLPLGSYQKWADLLHQGLLQGNRTIFADGRIPSPKVSALSQPARSPRGRHGASRRSVAGASYPKQGCALVLVWGCWRALWRRRRDKDRVESQDLLAWTDEPMRRTDHGGRIWFPAISTRHAQDANKRCLPRTLRPATAGRLEGFLLEGSDDGPRSRRMQN